MRGSTVATDDNRERRATLGASYDFGRARAFAGYRWYYGDFASSSLRTNLYWIGANYQVTPAITLTGAAYYTDVRNSGGDLYSFVLSGTYAFSKRTDLYTIVAYAQNRDGSAMGLSGFGPSLNRSASTLTPRPSRWAPARTSSAPSSAFATASERSRATLTST